MSKQYVINSTKQLIDLNDTLINYKIAWRVVSGTPPDAPPFDIAIVNQAVLNSSPNDIEFKTVDNGEISGELENNDNKFQNWYIVLKASQEIPVMVDIQKQEIAPAIQQPVNFGAANTPPLVNSNPPSRSYTVIIICVLVILCGGYYWWITRNSTAATTADTSAEASSEEVSSKKGSISKKSSSPAKSSSSNSPFAFQRSPATENILKRLGKK